MGYYREALGQSGYFKVRRALVVTGGTVIIGPDTLSNLYSEQPGKLKTDAELCVNGLTVCIGGTPYTMIVDKGMVGFRANAMP